MKKQINGYTLNHFMKERKVGQTWVDKNNGEIWICPTIEVAETIRQSNFEWTDICIVSGAVNFRLENGLYITQDAKGLIIKEIQPEPNKRKKTLNKVRNAYVQVLKDASNNSELVKKAKQMYEALGVINQAIAPFRKKETERT